MLSLSHITKSFDERLVLDDVSLSIGRSEVVALVGENGAGKTTLLKIILGEIQPDGGNVSIDHEFVGYVPQGPPVGKLASDIFEKVTPTWRIDFALSQVGLENLTLRAKIAELSGGQKTRLSLARVLSSENEPTILLLDEPTNNLDSEGLDWLEKFVKSFRGGVILVSHDRAFINNVATKIIELDRGKLNQYGGDYDFYKSRKEAERQTEINEYEQSIEERRRLQKLRNRQAGQMQQVSTKHFDKMKHEDKAAFHGMVNLTQRSLGKTLRALDSRIEQLAEIDRPESVKNYGVNLAGEVAGGKLLLGLEKLSKSYGKPLFSDVNIEIRGGEHVHIKGKNGSGKTTLLKIAASMIEPTSGSVKIGKDVRIGYFSQDVDGLDYAQTGFLNLQLAGISPTSIFRETRSLGLTEADLRKRPGELSRGQQAKLGFAKLLLGDNQLLILDEPTNHLDIPTRERIELALKNYRGAILVASHDEYFLQQIGVNRTFTLGNPVMKLDGRS